MMSAVARNCQGVSGVCLVSRIACFLIAVNGAAGFPYRLGFKPRGKLKKI
jgi:hypothetical protein